MMRFKRLAVLCLSSALAMCLAGSAEAAKKKAEPEEYPLFTILETTGHAYKLQDDSYEATDTKGGYRHYICEDCGDEYSYETDPLVYTTNPKTGEAVDQKGAHNPILPFYEHMPDGEPQVFWSKADEEWRVYIYGSHDVTGDAMCYTDYVTWSAPVYDLSDWRDEGVILDISEGDPYGGKKLYAPDVAYDLQTDTYFQAANEAFSTIVLRVADNPAGPWDQKQAYWVTSFKKAYDPSVYIEDGVIYVAGACRRDEEIIGNPEVFQALTDDGFTSGSGQICGIYQLKADPQDGDGIEKISFMPNDNRIYTPIYEGASLFGWCEDLGVYLFLYVGNEQGADGTTYNSGIGYMWTEDLMNGPWHYGDNGIENDVPEGVEQTLIGGYGNIISDTSGRIYRDPETGEMTFRDFPTYLHGNNHGSMEKINGNWYFNGHRQTNGNTFSREAVMGKLGLAKKEETGEPVITPMEFTSSGPSDSLDAYKVQEARFTNYLLASEDSPAAAVEETNPAYSQIEEGISPYVAASRDKEATHASPITNLQKGNIAGFQYLDFGPDERNVTLKMLISKPDGAVDGSADIYLDAPSEEAGGKKIGTISLAASDLSEETEEGGGALWSWASGAVDEPVSGVHGLFLVFSGEESGQICMFDQFVFE